jgi:branched-chain amino acid transport system permease protein
MDVLTQVLVSSVLLAAVYYILSLGLNIIFGVLDIVNFAHGAMIILGAYATYYLNALTGWNPFVLVIFDGIIVAGIGAILYLGYLRFTTNSPLVRMFALIGFSSVVVAALLVLSGSTFRDVTVDYGLTEIFGVTVRVSQIVAFFFAIVLGAITLLALNYTKVGKAVNAVTDDRVSVQLSGINDRNLSLLAFSVGAGLAGASGGVISSYIAFIPESGLTFAIVAFSVVIIGGLGDLKGGAIAALIVALLQTAVNVYVSSALVNTALFLTVLLVLLFRPRGILGKGRV